MPTTAQPVAADREVKESINNNTTTNTSQTGNNIACFQNETPSTIGHLISLKSASKSQSISKRAKPEKPISKSTISFTPSDLSSLKRTAEIAFVQPLAASSKKSKAKHVQGKGKVDKVSDSIQTVNTPEIQTDLREKKKGNPDSGPKRHNPGGRPKTTHIKQKGGSGRAVVLRKNKPVVTEIPLDVWQNILAFCPLDFLLKARSISRSFRLALNYESTWREARMRNYGPDCPDPPASLTEMQYADLLTGHGCQIKTCQEKSRKTYWTFQRRWCENCLRQRIVMHYSSQALIKEYPELFNCIQHATFDKWDNYQCVGTYTPTPSWLKNPGDKIGYERLAVANIIEEIEKLRSADADGNVKSTEEIDEWFASKAKSTSDLITKLQSIENWVECQRRKKLDDGKNMKDLRAAFFEKKAITMDPPLELAALQKTQSFNRAILIAKLPSEKSWKVLSKKLEVERNLAEQIVKEDSEDNKLTYSERYRMFCVTRPKDHFSNLNPPELNAPLGLVDDIIRRLEIGGDSSNIADQDFIPLVLKEVHREYYKLEPSSKETSLDGSYRLLLEDARNVYIHRLEPIVRAWDSEPRTKAATRLKCPLCSRKDVNRRWSFIGLMDHIGERHASTIMEFSHWRKRGHLFLWNRIEWPPNLPVLADHHTATGKWNLDDNCDYQQLPRPSMACSENYDSAFKNRRVSMELGVQGSANNDFIENILYAASELRATSLAPEYITQVVFQFALQKFKLSCDTAPDFDIVEPLQVALLRTGNHTLFEGFRCQWCCEQPEPSKSNRFINRGQPFGDLMRHFSTFFHPRHEWTTRSLKFRSVEDLSFALHQPEHIDAFQVFNRLFPPFVEGFLDPRLVFGS